MTLDISLALPSDFSRGAAETFASKAQRMIGEEADVPGAVLRALIMMARHSSRHQAEIQMALHRAELILSQDQQEAALQHLLKNGSIKDVIPLDDGGVLVTVTSFGMQRGE